MRRSVDINTAYLPSQLNSSLSLQAQRLELLSLYSRSPGTNGVTAVLLITSLLSHSSSALRHLVALARLHGVHDLNTLPVPAPPVPMSSTGPVPESSVEANVEQSLEAPIAQVSSPSGGSHPPVPLFLSEQESPTSPSPPPRSPVLPLLFGSVASLSIDLTGDDDELYETEEAYASRIDVAMEGTESAVGQGIVKEESL
ncbi:hypothetical protein GG344DRAFT_84426 [Lentinula edodes]|nr:hypothetical protein GG344DRAFT_84426 [Lentinula edodes]